MQYGQPYTNPLATGSSPDAQITSILQGLQNISSGQVNAPQSLSSLSQPAQSSTGLSSTLGGSGVNNAGAGVSASSLGGLGKVGGALNTVGSAANILGGLSNIYFGLQANKLAKKQFNFQRDAFNNNLENTVQSYNTGLEDRIRARHNTEGRSSAETSAYLNNNRLSANTI